MISDALRGDLDAKEFEAYPIFRMEVPREVPGVPKDMLFPRNIWDDPAAYDDRVSKPAGMFQDNFGNVCQRCGIEEDAVFPKKDTDS